ncbi:carbohydrate ABC transporter permease [Priestia koreensis]|uniref:carbohydrate ABC transporter permease n=1 Tax=Priestia koreensis TaxID=284581 RepID=UPI003CFD1E13
MKRSKTMHVVMILVTLLIAIPLLWVFLNSFKTSKQILTDPWSLPESITLKNYLNAWGEGGLGVGFINSAWITLLTVFLIVLISSMAAYVLAKKMFRLKRVIYLLFLMGLMLPTFLAMTPLFLLLNDMNLLNTYAGLIMVYVAFSLPFTIFMLTAFFRQIPSSLEEAAIIDGCGPFMVFWRIVIPLAKPGLISAAIFNFVGIWNEYVLALILISDDESKTLPLKMANLMMVQQYRTDYGSLYAGIILSIIPVMMFYLFFQRQLIEGSVAGGIKE